MTPLCRFRDEGPALTSLDVSGNPKLAEIPESIGDVATLVNSTRRAWIANFSASASALRRAHDFSTRFPPSYGNLARLQRLRESVRASSCRRSRRVGSIREVSLREQPPPRRRRRGVAGQSGSTTGTQSRRSPPSSLDSANVRETRDVEPERDDSRADHGRGRARALAPLRSRERWWNSRTASARRVDARRRARRRTRPLRASGRSASRTRAGGDRNTHRACQDACLRKNCP